MRKTFKTVVLILTIGLLSLMLVSCSKTAADSGAFKALAQTKGYTVDDAISQFSDTPQIKEVFVAYPADRAFQIEFYVIDNADSAKSFYGNQSTAIESLAGSVYSGGSMVGQNYAKRTMISDGTYTMVEYIENTLVYVPKTPASNQSAIEEFLKELHY